MKNPIRNNLIIELHVPDLNAVKEFYSKLSFEVSIYDEPNEKDPGYLTMTRKDDLGNTILNFYGGDERVYNQSFFKQFPKEQKEKIINKNKSLKNSPPFKITKNNPSSKNQNSKNFLIRS